MIKRWRKNTKMETESNPETKTPIRRILYVVCHVPGLLLVCVPATLFVLSANVPKEGLGSASKQVYGIVGNAAVVAVAKACHTPESQKLDSEAGGWVADDAERVLCACSSCMVKQNQVWHHWECCC